MDLTRQHHSFTSASHSCSCPVSDEVEQEAEKHLVTAANQILSMTQKLQTFRHQRVCSPVLVQTESKSWRSGVSLSTGAQTPHDYKQVQTLVVKILLSHVRLDVWNQTYSRLHLQLGLRRPNSQEHLHRCAHLTNQRHSQPARFCSCDLRSVCESRSFYVKQGKALTFLSVRSAVSGS